MKSQYEAVMELVEELESEVEMLEELVKAKRAKAHRLRNVAQELTIQEAGIAL